jgi:Domain of unknown function (DUF4396)
MLPPTLHVISWVSLAVAIACSVVIVADEFRRPQPMWIMNVVWPISALFGSALWLLFYLRHGRNNLQRQHDPKIPAINASTIAKATTHCGAGCALGDLAGEFLVLLAPGIAVIAGWKTLFEEKLFAAWVIDFVFAYAAGIVIQYLTIAPMRQLSFGRGLVQALKADTVSITAWQVGMYGAMAMIQFLWFSRAYGHVAEVSTPEFWFAMQIAMLCGFCTSYPVNALLLRSGVKEPM